MPELNSAPSGARGEAPSGEVHAAYQALREQAVWLHPKERAVVRLVGSAARRFLNGYVTCDVSELANGDGCYGFATTREGRVFADLVVTSADEALTVEVDPAVGSELADHLEKFVLTDPVAVERGPEGSFHEVWVAGPDAPQWLDELGLSVPTAPWSWTLSEVEANTLRSQRRGLFPLPLVAVTGDREAIGWMKTALAQRAPEAAFSLLETVRLEAGIPRFGADFGPEHFPQETGLEEEAVSYEKGCYLGQEVVARIHYRGQVHKRLHGLRIDGLGEKIATGTAITASGGGEIGSLGSSAFSPSCGGWIGLGVLKKAEIGDQVAVGDEGVGHVDALPFVDFQEAPRGENDRAQSAQEG